MFSGISVTIPIRIKYLTLVNLKLVMLGQKLQLERKPRSHWPTGIGTRSYFTLHYFLSILIGYTNFSTNQNA